MVAGIIAKMISKVYANGRKLDAQSIYDFSRMLVPFLRLQSTSFDPTLIVAAVAEFSDYDRRTADLAETVLVESFSWMLHNGFMARDFRIEDPNVYVLTRAAYHLDDIVDFDMQVKLSQFPFDLLHHSFVDVVRIQIERGELTLAIGAAYKVIERTIRDLERDCGLSARQGTPDAAVKVVQMLGKDRVPDKEVQHVHNMITNAFGIYRNPVAHDPRQVDHEEMVDALMVASAAMRLLDSFLRQVDVAEVASRFPRSVA